ncbi:hypothetical protein [Albidovulum sp.]
MKVDKRMAFLVASAAVIFVSANYLGDGGQAPAAAQARLSSAVPEPSRPVPVAPVAPAAQPLRVVAADPILPDPPAAGPVLFTAVELVSAQTNEQTPAAPEDVVEAGFADAPAACAAPTLDLRDSGLANIRVIFSDPCAPDRQVTIRHGALSFSAIAGEDGVVDTILPALAANEPVVVDYGEGESLSAMLAASGLDQISRFVVQWQGRDGFRLDAMAAIMEVAGKADGAMPLGGAYVTILGAPAGPAPRMAAVYTGPAWQENYPIAVEAEVTAGNCGRTLSGTVLRMAAGSLQGQNDIRIEMPGCDAVGDFVRLEYPAPLWFASAG